MNFFFATRVISIFTNNKNLYFSQNFTFNAHIIFFKVLMWDNKSVNSWITRPLTWKVALIPSPTICDWTTKESQESFVI